MHNTSLEQRSHPSANNPHELTAGGSIESTVIHGLRQASLAVPANFPAGHSPQMLPVLPRKGSRNAPMQKKGLALNHNSINQRELVQGGVQGPGAPTAAGRNPFALHTERLKSGADDYTAASPGIRGVGLAQAMPKYDTAAKKANLNTASITPSRGKAQPRNASNPFSTGGASAKAQPGQAREHRPDSIISGGRAGSPDDSMMYQNKFSHPTERT